MREPRRVRHPGSNSSFRPKRTSRIGWPALRGTRMATRLEQPRRPSSPIRYWSTRTARAHRIYERRSDQLTGLRAANFPLPAEDNDINEAAQRTMRSGSILLAVLVTDGPPGPNVRQGAYAPAELPLQIHRSDFYPLEGFSAPAAKRSATINNRAVLVLAGLWDTQPHRCHDRGGKPSSRVSSVLSSWEGPARMGECATRRTDVRRTGDRGTS